MKTITHYEFEKPPKGKKIYKKFHPAFDRSEDVGLKFFIFKKQPYYKTEFGWLPESECGGMGRSPDKDELQERCGW